MTGHLNGAPNRLDNIIQFHVGDVISSLSVTPMQAGGQDVILFTTMMGSIGALVPFQSRTDVDFFQHLEMHLRSKTMFRSQCNGSGFVGRRTLLCAGENI